MSDEIVNFVLLPEQSLPRYIHSTKDIYEHRSLLKQLLLNEYTLNYLLDIVIASVKNKTRIRTLDCLRVIRAVLRNNSFGLKISNETISKLFFLHQTFIFHKNEQVCACANVLVKSQRLDDESIAWVISNWEKSDHLKNRLLRYPENHPLINQWATEIYQSGKMQDRKSEIIGILISENIPAFVSESRSSLIWAIYYSKVPNEIKQKLLIENFSMESIESLWEVAIRLKFSKVIEFMQKKVRDQQNGE
jgi:hypothetical protein